MKINEETTVSEEQVLFNKLRYEDQELIIKIMKTLQPCELSCETEEEKKIPEKLGECAYVDGEIAYSWSKSEAKLKTKINEIIDYLSKAQVILDNQIADMQQNLWEEQELSELFKDKYEKMKESAEILSKGYNELEEENQRLKEVLNKYEIFD